MKERFVVQGHFSDFSKEWPAKQERLLGPVRGGVFNRAFDFWESFNLPLSDSSENEYRQLEREGLQVTFNPQLVYRGTPRICDVVVPDRLRTILDAYGEKTGYGEKTFLALELGLTLYDKLPIPPQEDKYGWLGVEDEYERWFRKIWREWFDAPPKSIGWEVRIKESERCSISFDFSTQGKLRGLALYQIFPLGHRMLDLPLAIRARFRGQKLVSFWQEAPNGAFFPDPKGEQETIWPYWVKGVSRSFDKRDRGELATEADWEKYLEKVRKRERVISGRTGKFVYQTERQARENLESSRHVIYYNSVQVFYFRKTPGETRFKSELGYRASGRYGYYVAETPFSYHQLSPEETAARLSEWNPREKLFEPCPN